MWITADVHYCATHLYEPGRAQFTDFEPFYEFVSGPLHAGGFGPNELDDTFGPRVVFTKNPAGRVNAPPTEGGLYFGHVRIDGKSGVMTVSHRDLAGTVLHSIDLSPASWPPPAEAGPPRAPGGARGGIPPGRLASEPRGSLRRG